ncbi:MAG: hypothetical protein WC632_04615 [Candidatus Margulisiibacteriota bacterium]
MKIKLSLVILSLMVMAAILMNGCGQSKPGPVVGVAEMGSVRVLINWPAGKGVKASSIPTSASTIIIAASADDMTPVSAEVTYPQTVGTLEVKVGANRTISATAKTSSGAIVASGEVAGVTVSLGTNTPVNIVLAPAAGRNYFPNTDGYSWQYNLNQSGAKMISTFNGTTVINGSLNVQKYESTYLDSNGNVYLSTIESYHVVNDSGVYFHGYPSYSTVEGSPLLLFPLETGKSWTYSSSGIYKTIITVMGQETITVPAGSFDCYKVAYVSYNGTVESSRVNYWFGNGVGLVKSTLDNANNDTIVLDSKNF